MNKHPIIAIDGPAGAGKSTVALRLAQQLGWTLLDTGAIYRALALYAQEQDVPWADAATLGRLARTLAIEFHLRDGINRVLLQGRDATSLIRQPHIARGASQVSAHPEVRDAFLALQRHFAQSQPVIAEGRDMGTVVFPEAPVKIFLTAAAKIRAGRRYQELVTAGHQANEKQVLAEQQARDNADSQREVAPLKPAPDATIIDTTTLTIEQVVDKIIALFEQSRAAR